MIDRRDLHVMIVSITICFLSVVYLFCLSLDDGSRLVQYTYNPGVDYSGGRCDSAALLSDTKQEIPLVAGGIDGSSHEMDYYIVDASVKDITIAFEDCVFPVKIKRQYFDKGKYTFEFEKQLSPEKGKKK